MIYLTNVNKDDEPTTQVWLNDTHAHHCNRLRRTDGQIFKPKFEKEDTIYTFEPQLCRYVFYRHWKESVVKGIDTYRFRVPPEYFHSPLVNSDNACYCNRNITLCDRNGVLDISHCQYQTLGAPLIMSNPYWNNGDRSLRKQFKSELMARNELNDENYGTYLDIEPAEGLSPQLTIQFRL
ncbi:unnamed protein product [Medioppia subpectinata]|uniref:Uncharacterized protein n=1 Tax=Medioppia subpectinata TaxID=1979941 RepID=A0A7R9KGS5_9ACAR|nr:unnamed protein product [Medioppia subpectinata]CAG2103264.1 unnamed protein product [Medioppia subpectinata]